MQEFLLAVKLGVAAGALDALLALGIVLIYRTSGVLNFAQAGTGVVAAYAAYSVAQGQSLWVAVPAGLLIGAAIGTATYAVIGGIRSSRYALTSAVATLAVAILLRQIVGVFWGTITGQFPNPFPLGGFTLDGVVVDYSTIARVSTAAGLVLAIGAMLRWTRTGTMLRALADNPEAVLLCGGNVHALLAGVWAVAGTLAAVAGLFVAQTGLTPSFMDTFLIGALIAAVVGGLRSLTGAFLGAIGLEVARNLFGVYEPRLLSVDLTPYTQTFVIVLLIGVLIVVPRRWLGQNVERRV